jgi:hypothetical protein
MADQHRYERERHALVLDPDLQGNVFGLPDKEDVAVAAYKKL